MPDNERMELPATYSPRPCKHPDVQRLWGEALAKVGQQTNDARLQRLGWLHIKVASETKRKE
jgi:hypothetical protein